MVHAPLGLVFQPVMRSPLFRPFCNKTDVFGFLAHILYSIPVGEIINYRKEVIS